MARSWWKPQPLLTSVPRLPGLDNRKMSKSYGNTIDLTDDEESIAKKVRQMYTDPKRVRADIPGTVEGNPVFMYHDTFNPDTAEVDDLKERYRAGKVGDVEVKTKLARALNAALAPMRERRREVMAKPRARSRDRGRRITEGSGRGAGHDGARAGRGEAAILRGPRRAILGNVTDHTDFESSPDAYQVKLDTFEGPLDLLLHLIRKNEVNIYDIPISLITEQYLGFIEMMQELNLDVAGEFLVMASTLIHIKSRMLLPRPDPSQDEVLDEGDPREALVRRLLEHQKYKAAAELLHERETLRSAQFMRPDARVADAAGDDYEPELEVDLFGLLAAFRGVLQRANRRVAMPLPPEQISIEGRMRSVARTALGIRCLRVRGSVQRWRRLTRLHDRHVPRAPRNDPAQVDSCLSVGRRWARSGSTNVRGR